MNSLKCSISISEKTLLEIQESSKTLGYCKAVRQILDLPDFPEEKLKTLALANFVNLSTGILDQYFIERCWICAYGYLMKVNFEFPHIDPYILRNPIP